MMEDEAAVKVSGFYRRIHRLYSWLGRASFWLRYRMTALAWSSMAGFIVITMLSGLGVFLSVIHIIGLIIALWLVAFIGLWFCRGELTIVRELAKTGSVGEKMPYRVTLSRGRKKISNFLIVEQPPNPNPTPEDFFLAREPGEEMRNGFDQRFAYYRWQWLIERRKFFEVKVSAMLSLRENKRIQLECELIPLRRGVLELSEAHCIIPEPLGLLQRYRRINQTIDQVVVLPKRFPLPSLKLSGTARNQFGGEAMSRFSGQSGEFVSLRDYRPGDSRRMIHWKSWAKTGSPVIKEVEEEFFPRYGLVLDTAIRGDRDHIFEVAVSVAASFACAVDTKKSLLDVMFLQQNMEVHTLGKDISKTETMLETLAGVSRQNSADWNALQNAVLMQSDVLSSCIIVLADWSEQRRRILKAWTAAGIELLVLFIDESRESANKKLKRDKACCKVIAIGADSVEIDLFQLGAK